MNNITVDKNWIGGDKLHATGKSATTGNPFTVPVFDHFLANRGAFVVRSMGAEYFDQYNNGYSLFEPVGACAVCGHRVFRENGADPDFRGMAGMYHSCSTLVASEYGMEGDDVLLCAECAQTRSRYETGVKIAKRQWKEQ